jgi:dolichol-phosphate mannosyltransferase
MSRQDHPIVSIVVPVKDEQESIEALADEINRVLDQVPFSWECIWVDDGSTDRSLLLLKRLAAADGRHRLLSFEKHAGKSAAWWAGFRASRGSVLVTIDGDGQNDPADIPGLVDMVRADRADLVHGFRADRKDSAVRRLSSIAANGFRDLLAGETVKDAGCAVNCFKRACTDGLPRFSGFHRFMPTLASVQGFSWVHSPVNHRPRVSGRSKYNIRNRLWVGLVDTFGVLWLKKRGFQYRIAGSENPVDSD